MELTTIFEENDSGTVRMVGYVTVDYSSNNEAETIVESTESELTGIFEAAPVNELAGTGDPIQAAVDDPLSYRDFLVLKDGEIVFDEEHSRDQNEG